MLTAQGCRQRQHNLWSLLPDQIHQVLIGDARHVQYFCGFRPHPISFSADQSSALLLTRGGQSILFAENFTRRTASVDVFATEEKIGTWYDHQHSVENRHHALVTTVANNATMIDSSVLLVEREGISAELASTMPDAATEVHMDGDVCSLGTIIRRLRRSKLPDEVDLLQRCMDAGAAGQAAAFDAIVPGATELDVYIAVQSAAERQAGCACIVYGDFRATNATQFKAGGLPGNYELRAGDLMILDFSVVVDGYRSDFTNTVAVTDPTDLQASQAAACIAALKGAESTLTAGTPCAAVFETAASVLIDKGYSGLPHHAGHGLGMEHPEAPILVPHSADTLEVGDVVTLEPGLYIEGTGGMRFEHNYLITDSDPRRLSHHHLGLQRD